MMWVPNYESSRRAYVKWCFQLSELEKEMSWFCIGGRC